jgi:hypothetical protein
VNAFTLFDWMTLALALGLGAWVTFFALEARSRFSSNRCCR